MHIHVGPHTAEAASEMGPICFASEHSLLTSGIPKVWCFRLIVEHAAVSWRNSTCWTRHRPIVWILTAETTLNVPVVCIATHFAHAAIGIPIVRQMWSVVKCAPRCWTAHVAVVTYAAEAALWMNSISHASDRGVVLGAAFVPVEGNLGVVREVTSGCRLRLNQGGAKRDKR